MSTDGPTDERPDLRGKLILTADMRARIARLANPDEGMRSLIEQVTREIEITRKANEDEQ